MEHAQKVLGRLVRSGSQAHLTLSALSVTGSEASLVAQRDAEIQTASFTMSSARDEPRLFQSHQLGSSGTVPSVRDLLGSSHSG